METEMETDQKILTFVSDFLNISLPFVKER